MRGALPATLSNPVELGPNESARFPALQSKLTPA